MPECSDACESMAGWSRVLYDRISTVMAFLYWVVPGVFVFYAPRLVINWINVSPCLLGCSTFCADRVCCRTSRKPLMQRDIFKGHGMKPIARFKTRRCQGTEGTRDRKPALHWNEPQSNALLAGAGIAIEQIVRSSRARRHWRLRYISMPPECIFYRSE